MKTAGILLLALFSSLVTFGCTETSAAKIDKSLGGGEVIEDDNYGTMSEFDKKQMGDCVVTIFVNDWYASDVSGRHDPAIRVHVKGNQPERRIIHAWLVDSLGNVVTPHAIGNWSSSRANFLLKLNLREKSVKHGMYKLFIRVDQAEDSWDVRVRGNSTMDRTSSESSNTTDSSDIAATGSMVAMSEKRLGDHDVTIYVNEWRSSGGPQPRLYVVVQNNLDERHNGHVVRAWLTDSMGNKVMPRANGKWRNGNNDYNCPCDLSSRFVPAGAYKLWISVDEAEDSWDVSVK